MKGPLYRAAKPIVERLRAAGFEAYFVGGCVRDWVMGRDPKDIDVATSARPQQVQKLFRRTIPVGVQFGVVLVREGGEEFEVATFRADGEYLDGRRPTTVHFCDAKADVERRDFTINGMLYDPVTEQVIDYVGGQQDIAHRVIRCIGEPAERFEEDKLRLMRAVRFACGLGFDIEPATLGAAKRAASQIAVVSAERIRDELLRILTEGGATRGIELLADMGVLEVILPEVAAMAGVPQPPEYHPEGDVLTHTLLALSHMESPSPELAMAVLLHDVGKPVTITHDDRIRFNGHDVKGAAMARTICRRLKLSNAQTDAIEWIVLNHMRIAFAPEMRLNKLKRLLREEHFSDLLQMHRLDCIASHGRMGVWDFCRSKLEELSPEVLKPRPLLGGRELIEMGYKPGPAFKAMLEAVETAQLEGEIATREAAEQLVRERFPRS